MDVPGNRNSSQTPIRGARAPIPGRPLPQRPAPVRPAAPSPSQQRDFAPLDGIVEAAGLAKLEGFSLKKLFSEVFGKHGENEMEEYITGCPPEPHQVPRLIPDGWPTPWVFARLFLASIAAILLLDFGVIHFQSVNLLPGYILLGSFAMPVVTLVFFLEMNAWRNVSLYQVIRFFILGGILSLIISLFFFDTAFSQKLNSAMGDSDAGIIEECGKLITLVLIAGRSKYDRKLNGLLLGAAIGAGFAAFESSGYAFRILIGAKDGLNFGACRSNIILRGILAPFGHVVWTAIAGAAIWRIKGGEPFKLSLFAKWKFLRLFAVPVLMHMLWNSSWDPPFYLKYIIIAIIDWTVAFALVQEGLRELRECHDSPVSNAIPRTGVAQKNIHAEDKLTFTGLVWGALVFAFVTFFTGLLLAAGSAFFNKVILPAFSGS